MVGAIEEPQLEIYQVAESVHHHNQIIPEKNNIMKTTDYVYIYVCVCVLMYMCAHFMCMYVYMYVPACLHICMYMHVFVNNWEYPTEYIQHLHDTLNKLFPTQ